MQAFIRQADVERFRSRDDSVYSTHFEATQGGAGRVNVNDVIILLIDNM
jgi:hypothetical protein